MVPLINPFVYTRWWKHRIQLKRWLWLPSFERPWGCRSCHGHGWSSVAVRGRWSKKRKRWLHISKSCLLELTVCPVTDGWHVWVTTPGIRFNRLKYAPVPAILWNSLESQKVENFWTKFSLYSGIWKFRNMKLPYTTQLVLFFMTTCKTFNERELMLSLYDYG